MKILHYFSIAFSLVLLCTLSYGFCPPGGGSSDLNTITGVVKDSSGKPIHNVKVRIKDTYMFYITDEKGFFIFSNVDKENVTLTFEHRIASEDPDSPGFSMETAVLELSKIGMKKVLFIEDIVFKNGIATAKTIHIKSSYDLTGMTPEDFRVFQLAGASMEDQVRAFLGIREEK